jgi:hypothetical protein
MHRISRERTKRVEARISQQIYTNRAYLPDEETDNRAFNLQE